MDLDTLDRQIKNRKKEILNINERIKENDRLIEAGGFILFLCAINIFLFGINLFSVERINYYLDIEFLFACNFIFYFYINLNEISIHNRQLGEKILNIYHLVPVFIFTFLLFDIINFKEIVFSYYDYCILFVFYFLLSCMSINYFLNLLYANKSNRHILKNKNEKLNKKINDSLKDSKFVNELIERKGKYPYIYNIFIENEKNKIDELVIIKYKKENNLIIND